MRPMTTVHCFGDDALASWDAVGLATAIRTGLVSREEVVEAAIRRVERIDPYLSAVQVECFDRAWSDRATAGPFAGVPTFVKDDTDVRGLPTGHGSRAFRPRPARSDAAPAKQFLAQGFALLGKSKLPELGLTATTEYVDRPPTRNPWNTARSAGGSSGGAGALVASGAVPIAHANDGGGSIRIPAAVNGLVGLKLTRCRLLDQAGVRQAPVNLVSEGVLTRSVRDTAHYLAGAERFHSHPSLERVGLVEGAPRRRLRIGLIRHDVFGRSLHPDIDAVLCSAASALTNLGHELIETPLGVTPRFIEDFKLYWALTPVFMGAFLAASYRRAFRPGELDPVSKGLARLFWRNPAGVIPAIPRLRREAARYQAHFASLDVLLSPVTGHPAPKLGHLRPDQPFEELMSKLVDYVAFTPINNVAGGPAMALPHGMLAGGLPGSIQLAAPCGGERMLLELAYELEAISPFPQIRAAAAGSPETGAVRSATVPAGQ
jgi:amidase